MDDQEDKEPVEIKADTAEKNVKDTTDKNALIGTTATLRDHIPKQVSTAHQEVNHMEETSSSPDPGTEIPQMFQSPRALEMDVKQGRSLPDPGTEIPQMFQSPRALEMDVKQGRSLPGHDEQTVTVTTSTADHRSRKEICQSCCLLTTFLLLCSSCFPLFLCGKHRLGGRKRSLRNRTEQTIGHVEKLENANK